MAEMYHHTLAMTTQYVQIQSHLAKLLNCYTLGTDLSPLPSLNDMIHIMNLMNI